MTNITELLEISNIDTAVYYNGDEANEGGYGKITNNLDDYLGDLVLEITLDDGRVLLDVTPQDFEAKTVLGNTQMPEFQLADGYEVELGGWGELADEESYDEENSVWPLQY